MSHLCEFMFSVLSMANLVYSSFKMLKCHVIKDFVALSFLYGIYFMFEAENL